MVDLVRAIRSFAFAMPLAILVGSVVAPPDVFTQLFAILAALVVGWPLSYRLVAVRAYTARAIGGFYLVVFVVVLLGVWGVTLAGLRAGAVRVAARVVVIGVALVIADLAVFGRPIR